MRDENQLHAAVVELVALTRCSPSSTRPFQNWYPGDKNGVGGIYNFVTKRGASARASNSKISWTQVETGSAITWKYPSCILQGDNSVGEFYSVAVTNNMPAGRHRHEDDPHRRGTRAARRSSRRASRPASGIEQSYRGLVKKVFQAPRRARAQLFAVRLAADGRPSAAPIRSPTSRSDNPSAHVEHEATTSKIGEDQLFYCRTARAVRRRRRLDDRQRLLSKRFCKSSRWNSPSKPRSLLQRQS